MNICIECGKSYEIQREVCFDCMQKVEKDRLAISIKCNNQIKHIKELETAIEIYNIQFKSAMKAQSLGLCKKVISHAIKDVRFVLSKNK